MQDPLWIDVERIEISCRIGHAEPAGDLADRICRRAAGLAERAVAGRIPVSVLGVVDRAGLDRDVLHLAIQAHLSPAGEGAPAELSLSLHPERNAPDLPKSGTTGGGPVTVPYAPPEEPTAAELDRALTRLLRPLFPNLA